jgi:hypothetical protein
VPRKRVASVGGVLLRLMAGRPNRFRKTYHKEMSSMKSKATSPGSLRFQALARLRSLSFGLRLMVALATVLVVLLASFALLRQTRMAAPLSNGTTSAPECVKLTLSGEEAVEQLKEGGQYSSLGEAIQAAFYRVEADPKSEGFYANNRAQQFSIRFTEGATQLSVKQPAKIKDHQRQAEPSQGQDVGLRFVGAGYGQRIQQVTGKSEMTAEANRFTYKPELEAADQSKIQNPKSKSGTSTVPTA